MSHYLIELYTPNAHWEALSVEQRQQFLHGVQNGMGTLSSMGVELLTLARTESGIDQSSEHRYLGIWRFPNPQARAALLAGIQASGWYGYFQLLNAACASGGFAEHLADLVGV